MLVTYLPKRSSLADKLGQTLQPSRESRQELAWAKGKGKAQGKGKALFKVNEKRLGTEHWMIDGRIHGGTHFPLAAYTNQHGRRSPARNQARAQRGKDRAAAHRRNVAPPREGAPAGRSGGDRPGAVPGPDALAAVATGVGGMDVPSEWPYLPQPATASAAAPQSAPRSSWEPAPAAQAPSWTNGPWGDRGATRTWASQPQRRQGWHATWSDDVWRSAASWDSDAWGYWAPAAGRP